MNTSTTTNKKEGNTCTWSRQDICDLEQYCGQGDSCNCSYQKQAKALRKIIKNRLNESMQDLVYKKLNKVKTQALVKELKEYFNMRHRYLGSDRPRYCTDGYIINESEIDESDSEWDNYESDYDSDYHKPDGLLLAQPSWKSNHPVHKIEDCLWSDCDEC